MHSSNTSTPNESLDAVSCIVLSLVLWLFEAYEMGVKDLGTESAAKLYVHQLWN